MTGQDLPRSERLKGRSALQQVMLVGRAVEDRLLIVRYLPAPSATGRRFAVTVSRGIRPAVRRNRLRRQLRELWRQGRDRLPLDGDFVLIGRRAALSAPFLELRRSFDRLSDALAD